MTKQPFVSILIVNFNGRHLLDDCLKSVFKINYPTQKYEVIVVDNDSQDDSVHFVRNNFPQVKLVQSEQNLGFAGGNNLGYQHAQGEYIALLNNDTRVDPRWLKEMVNTLADPQAGIACSKLYFHFPYLEFELKSATDLNADIYHVDDFSPLGLIVENIDCHDEEMTALTWYLSGFYHPSAGNYSNRWTNGAGKFLVPYNPNRSPKYTLTLHGHSNSHYDHKPFKILLGGKTVFEDTIAPREVKQLDLELSALEVTGQLKWLIQNAGNNVFLDGQGRDRGSVIKKTPAGLAAFYDFDGPYYQQAANLVAMCGASCLIKRQVITEVGLFAEHYYMYYEDLDFSFKAWRKGWEIVFCPTSVVYHKHRASTDRRTQRFFITMVDKNHLFFLLTHFPLRIFLINLFIFMFKFVSVMIIVKIFAFLHYYGSHYKRVSVRADARYAAWQELVKHGGETWRLRQRLLREETRGFGELVAHLY